MWVSMETSGACWVGTRQLTFALGMTAVAYFVFSARLTVASIALKGFACGPTRMTGFEDCRQSA